jgi:UDP-sugar diphosphatase
LLVKQFRPPVFVSLAQEARAANGGGGDDSKNNSSGSNTESAPLSAAEGDNQSGFTYELCAGLVDKSGKSLAAIASEEVLEECGYVVPPEELREVTTCRGNVGISGQRLTIFFAEVSEAQRANAAEHGAHAVGGGVASEGESIELVLLPVDRALEFMFDARWDKPASLSYGFMWFLLNHPRGQQLSLKSFGAPQ